VSFTTEDGTAKAGINYTAKSSTLTFGAGQLSASFVVPIMNAHLVQGPLTLGLKLSSPTGFGAKLGAQSTAILTIQDTNVAGHIQFGATTYTFAEGNVTAHITVTRMSGNAIVGASFHTVDGTAKAGTDYTATSSTVGFGAGQTMQTISVPLLDNGGNEPNSNFSIVLTSPTGSATLGSPTTTTVNITDDGLAGAFQFSTSAYTFNETAGFAQITVTRTGGAAGSPTVFFTTSDGSGTAGTNYTTTSGTLNFTPGETSASVFVPILTAGEGSVTVNLDLSSPTGTATLGAIHHAVLTITDTDTMKIQFSSPTYAIGGGNVAVIAVTRSSSVGSATVTFATSDGSGVAPTDYVSTTQTVSFSPGQTMAMVGVQTKDPTPGVVKTVNLRLSGQSVGADLGSPAAAVLDIVE
jgi:hypothetical protein